MLPNIDATTAPNVTSAAPAPAKRSESEQLVQDAYKVQQKIQDQLAGKTDQKSAADSTKASTVEQVKQGQKQGGKIGTRVYDGVLTKDEAKINFQMTRDERAVFLNYANGEEDVSEMSQEERDTLQKVSERLETLIENAQTRNTERTEKLEKAIKEWYYRLSNGKATPPTDLLSLIRQAAAGFEDFSKLDIA